MTRSQIYLSLGAIIAGHAGYWFLSGAHHDHSDMRNALVGLQALAGLALMYWAVKNKSGKQAT